MYFVAVVGCCHAERLVRNMSVEDRRAMERGEDVRPLRTEVRPAAIQSKMTVVKQRKTQAQASTSDPTGIQ
jgi:hypothetical protein